MQTPDSFLAGRRILVVAPHADDEVIGCGGLLLKARALGAETHVLVVTVADLQRIGDGGEVVQGEARSREVEEVAGLLGLTSWEILKTDEWSHLRLDAIPRRDLVASLEREARLSIGRLQPDLVFLPAPSYNQDHEAVTRAGLVACRPHDAPSLPMPSGVFLYEYPPNSWCLPQERFTPQLYVDISGQLEAKLEAYRRYRSQAREGLHQNSPENVRSLNLLRGREAGVTAAEAFQVLRLRG